MLSIVRVNVNLYCFVGVKLCGFAGFIDNRDLTETVPAIVKKYEDLLVYIQPGSIYHFHSFR